MIQHKHVYLTALVALWGLGCQNQPVNESLATDKAPSALTVENIKAFTSLPLNTDRICNLSTDQSCIGELQKMRLTLISQNIIPLPPAGEKASLSVEQATERYKNFLAAHANEPILSMFRQVYARVLLNQYGVLSGENYDLIQYYTRELSDENSLDFATLTKAARLLEGHVAGADYMHLVNSTVTRARAHQQSIQTRIRQLELATSSKTARGEQTGAMMAAQVALEKVQARQSGLTSELKQLIGLQSGLSHLSKL